MNAGPPKKPVGLVKKPAVSADDEPNAFVPPKAGGIGALASAMAAAATAKNESKDNEDNK